MSTALLLAQVPCFQALYDGEGPVTVAELMAAKYGPPPASRSIAVSLVARIGSGTVILRDTTGHVTDEIQMDATGVSGRREWVFQYTEIVEVVPDQDDPGLIFEVYA